MSLQSIFNQNPNIIINTDIDGILSGIILQKYCNCRIAGFSNSKETVWLANPDESVYSPVYIDMFVPKPNVVCIEQHIISVNKEHHDKFVNYGTKINPNLERGRVFESRHDYTYKYPFGTVHYILALLEAEGIKISLPNLEKTADLDLSIRLGDLVLRADDAMKTTLNSNYMANAKDWWGWLYERSCKASSIKSMIDYLNTIPYTNVDSIKMNTKHYFTNHFNCRTSDGGFAQITLNGTNQLLQNIINYIDEIANLMEITFNYPKKLYPKNGKYNLLYWSNQWSDDFIKNNTIQGKDVFSYGFIYGPGGRYQNFSFTTDMKDND